MSRFDVGHRVMVHNSDWRPFKPPKENETLNGAYGFVTHVEPAVYLGEPMVLVQITGHLTRTMEPDEIRKPWPFWESELQHAD